MAGGLIHRTRYWLVEHCVGPLGVGTLIVKPERHVVHVWELTADESAELGPLLKTTAGVVSQLADPDQVYVCLWSHGPVHIHFVVQPVDRALAARIDARGPRLQAVMFDEEPIPDDAAVERFAAAARAAFV